MIYYINHKYMDALQYVCAHVSSDYSSDWMIYYIYHRDMDAHQYAHVDVPSNDYSE
jgi:hypothetical protein